MQRRKKGVRLTPKSEQWRKLKDAVYIRDQGCCQSPHCIERQQRLLEWHMDHIIPVSKGGKNELNNLRVLCLFCHITRDDSNIEPKYYNSHKKLANRYIISRRLTLDSYKSALWRDDISKIDAILGKEPRIKPEH